jgi:hypothetical protein
MPCVAYRNSIANGKISGLATGFVARLRLSRGGLQSRTTILSEDLRLQPENSASQDQFDHDQRPLAILTGTLLPPPLNS